jgi:protocatechuate 3,4-dioxygenase beta subunit
MADESRLQAISARVISALRAVVREFAITEDELHDTGKYLDQMGAAGLFPALLDIAFAMTSIDATRAFEGATRRNLEGPMYKAGAPLRAEGNLLDSEPGPDAAPLTLRGRITDSVTGNPIPGAIVDIWQPDEHGKYDTVGFNLRGKIAADYEGNYLASTILPSDYAQHEHDLIGDLLRRLGMSNYRAAHIHLKVWVNGEELLTTQFFRSDSPFLDTDYVVGAVSHDLIVDITPVNGPDEPSAYAAVFDIAVPVGQG